MKFDAQIEPASLSDVPLIATGAERIGFDALWSSETRHDPFLPLAAYARLLAGSFGSGNAIANTLVAAAPLMFGGLAVESIRARSNPTRVACSSLAVAVPPVPYGDVFTSSVSLPRLQIAPPPGAWKSDGRTPAGRFLLHWFTTEVM